MVKKTKKVTPSESDWRQVQDLAQATGGGLVQLTGELRIQTTSQQIVVYEGSWMTVRNEGSVSWLFVWNEDYVNQPPNLMIRL